MNNNNIDKKIRNMLKKEKLDENPDYCEKLIRMSENLVKQPKNMNRLVNRKSFHLKYIPVVIFTILIAAYPVKAASDYVSSRLAKLSEEEKNELRTMIRSLDEEAIRYSRDFSESEQEQYDALLVQYDKGVFPQGTLSIVNDIHAANDETVYYNPEDNCIYLPDRRLTEEELLEMIDFYNKTDYSLRTSDASTKYRADMENKRLQLSVDALSEDEAVASAAFYVETMYGIATEKMEKRLNGNYGDYQITFTEDNVSYSVCIQADDASFKDISMDMEGFAYYHDNLKVKDSHLRKKGKEAKTIAAKLLGEKSAITDAYAQYKLNEKGQIPHGSVVYLFDLANGNRLRMSYSIAEDTLWGAAVEEGGAGHKDLNVKKDEERIYLHID